MEVKYRKILVPVDGSQNSLRALAHAVAIARCFDAELSILYVSVLSPKLPVTPQIQGDKIPAKAVSDPEAFAKEILANAAAHVPADIQMKTYSELGEPRTGIIDFAEKHGFDLLIIGSRGLGAISGLLLGSVSTYVIHHCQSPVLTVK